MSDDPSVGQLPSDREGADRGRRGSVGGHLRRLGSESVVYGLAGMATTLVGIVLMPFYTRIFSPADYGILSLVGATMSIVAIFVVLALDNSAFRWYWDTDDLGDRKRTLASWVWCQLTVATVCASVIFLEAEQLSELVGAGRSGAALFRLAAVAMPLQGFTNIAGSWFRMQRRPWAAMTFTLSQSVLTITTTILLVLVAGWGLPGVIGGQLGGALVLSLVGVVMMGNWLNPKRFRFSRLKEMLAFALPLIPSALALWVVGFGSRFVIERYAGTAELGLFQVGAAVASAAGLLTGAFQQAWSPFALSIHRDEGAKDVYAAAFLAYVWFGCVVSAGLALAAPEAIRLLATQRYAGAASVVGILALNHVVIGLGYIASLGLGIVKDTRPAAVAISLAALANVGLSVALVPRMGRVGAALAIVGSQAVVPAFLFWRAHRVYPVPYRFGAAGALLVLATVVIGGGAAIHVESLWMSLLVKAGVMALFVPAAILARVVSPAMVREWIRLWVPVRKSAQ